MERFFRNRDIGSSSQPETDRHLDTNVTRWQAEGEGEGKWSFRRKTLDLLPGGKKKRLQEQEKSIRETVERFKNDQKKQDLKDLEAEVTRYVTYRFETQDKLNQGMRIKKIGEKLGEDAVFWVKGFEEQMEHDPELRLHVQNKLEERRALKDSNCQSAYRWAYSEWSEERDRIGGSEPPPQPPAVVEFPAQVDLPLPPPPAYSDNQSHLE
jgi:hypothetical protein